MYHIHVPVTIKNHNDRYATLCQLRQTKKRIKKKEMVEDAVIIQPPTGTYHNSNTIIMKLMDHVHIHAYNIILLVAKANCSVSLTASNCNTCCLLYILHTASIPKMCCAQESTLCQEYGLSPAKKSSDTYINTIDFAKMYPLNNNINVETLSGETGGSSIGRTLFRMYNLSPRKHYTSINGRKVTIIIDS